MKTEINGDFKGYLTRFKLPSAKCFKMPLKNFGIIFLIEAALCGVFLLIGINRATLLIMLMQSLLMVGYNVGVLKDDFWNIVLEESKGLFADMLMWIYYIILCVFSLIPAFFFFYLSDAIIK